MELRIKSREWRLEADIPPGEAPDMTKAYTARLVYRPERLALTVRAASGEEPYLANADIHGRRVHKDGTLGADASEHFYYSVPEWLKPVVDRAIARCRRDLFGW